MTDQNKPLDTDNAADAAPEDKQPTAKDRVREAAGKDVGVDYFLYVCLEHEKMLKSPGSETTRKCWPSLKGVTPGDPLPIEIKDEPLDAVIEDLLAWYIANTPEVKAMRPLDHEVLNGVIPAVIGMTRDIELAVHLKTGEPLGSYERNGNKIWTTIEAAYQRAFPRHHTLFGRYLQWLHAPEGNSTEVVIGDRPPVGKFAPPPPRRTSGPGGGGGYGGGGDRPPRPQRGNDRGPPQKQMYYTPEGEAPPRGREANGNSERGSHSSSNFSRPQRGGGGFGGGGGGDRGRGPRRFDGPRQPQEASPELEAAALEEVKRAIAELAANPELDEVTLKPTNSFYRRIQHSAVGETGMFSFSVGEGRDRSLRVSRHNNKGD